MEFWIPPGKRRKTMKICLNSPSWIQTELLLTQLFQTQVSKSSGNSRQKKTNILQLPFGQKEM